MTEQVFTERLRELIRSCPFVPFTVHFRDGRSLVVDNPTVVFGMGAAGYLSETEGIIDIACGEVVSMDLLTAQTHS